MVSHEHGGKMKQQNRWHLLLAVLAMLITLVTTVAWASQETTAMPDWLEPRGLSVLDLVGQLPEEYLQGMILSYGDWDGIVVYESGSREGNTVVVTTTIYPRLDTPDWAPNNLLTEFGCLGHSPVFDHMGIAVPTSTLRVYDITGTEVTRQIDRMFITRMGTLQPIANSLESFRYPEDRYGTNQPYPLPWGPDGLIVPSNAGCWIKLPGADYYPLTGVFTLEFEPSVRVFIRGTQKATFRSYIGVGDMGIFQPLMDQMRATFGDRHGRILLSIPSNTDYFLLKFPPTPGDAYTDSRRAPPYLNAARPSAGTYRLSKFTAYLSGDLTSSAGFPLEVAWQDADQAPKSEYLPVISSPTQLAPPEYVVPAGMAYNDCFTQGNCPLGILQQIYDTEMSLEIIYLKVFRVDTGGQWVPLQMAGPAWSPGAALSPTAQETSVQASEQITKPYQTFLPFLSNWTEEVPGDCLCGWFDDLGRMLDYDPGTGTGSR